MKINLWILLLLLLGFTTVHAQHDFQLYVGLNMRDCINCMGGKLNQIEKLNKEDKDADIYLVIGKKYAVDSSLIIKKYNLHSITKRVIWSDKLLKKIMNGGSSSILFSSKYGTVTYRSLLEMVPDYLLNYIDHAGLSLDSLFPDYPNITLGLSQVGVGKIYVNEGKVYFINALTGSVNGYDLLSGKRVFYFGMTDSLLKVTFPYSGLPASQCDIQHKILQNAHFSPYQIDGLTFNQDTVYIRFENNYFVVEKGDSALKNDNVCVLKIVSGKVNHIYRYPYCFTNKLDNNRLYCTSNISGFHYYKNAIYDFIHADWSSNTDFGNFYMLGRFELNKDERYQLVKLDKIKNPLIYKRMSCENLCFDKGYFTFPLIDTLFSVTGDQPDIPLNYLSTDSDTTIITNPCSNGIAIRAFKMTDSTIWVAVQNNRTSLGTVLKYNRNTKKITRSKIVLHNMWSTHINFDPIDPDFILYATNESSQLYRKKMF